MYPMAWKADTKTVALKGGANTPLAAKSTIGMDWFRFDLNWLRTDTFLPGGNQAVSLFRGGRLTILSLSGGNITSCVWINMSLVGPNRPDWFLDDVGGGPIDNQYIGEKFIEYKGEPRLVREWRKNGITNEVFTLQVDEYLTDENNHTRYPLVANIPGEKKAYDHFKTWSNHKALELDDTAPFLLDQTLPPGACVQVPASRPNVTNTTKESALNLEPEAFKHVVWTGSPYSPPPSPPTPTPPAPGPKKGSYQCTVCEHVYDPVTDGGGLPFEQLPDSWTCPICGALKSAYKQVDGVWQH
jgi:rubredoxin